MTPHGDRRTEGPRRSGTGRTPPRTRDRTGLAPRFGAVALAGALALAAACGDGTSGPAETGLTQQEAEELAAALAGQTAEFAEDGGTGVAPSVSAEISVSPGAGVAAATFGPLAFHRTRTCPEGGEVAVEGTVEGETDPDAGTSTAHLEAEVVHDACGFVIRGTTFVVSGQPGLDLVADLAADEAGLEGPQTATESGTIGWEADDGRSGTCDVDLGWTLEPDAGTLTIAGTFCGVEVESTLSGQL